MTDPRLQALDASRSRLSALIGQQRVVLLAAGVGIVALGATITLAPVFFAESFLWAAGWLFAAAGLLRLGQWVVGRLWHGRQVHGRGPILTQVALDLALGWLLLEHLTLGVRLLGWLIGVAVLLDGLIQVGVALRLAHQRHRVGLLASGGLTCVLAVLAAASGQSGEREWLAYLLGAKLALFGGLLVFMALSVRGDPLALVYGSRPHRHVKPVPGEAYAVFIGNAFHLGVCVGEDAVVDFRDDNLVHRVTWEQFLLGREPQHWEYPDLEPVPAAEVCRYALAQVGQSHPYSFLTFNCEHFTIWCKTLGQARNSRYAQVAGTVTVVADYPFVGTVIELYTRALEWLAFKLGGTFGRRVSLRVRNLGAVTSRWLLLAVTRRELGEERAKP